MKRVIAIIVAVLAIAAMVTVVGLALRPSREESLQDITTQLTDENTPEATAEGTQTPVPEVAVPPDDGDTMSRSEGAENIEIFLNAVPNNGFLLSAYDAVRDVRLHEVLYQCEGGRKSRMIRRRRHIRPQGANFSRIFRI